jgi:hypothetical protein
LLQNRSVAFGGPEIAAKIKNPEVVLHIIQDAGKVAQRKEPDVPVVVLKGFITQRTAVVSTEDKPRLRSAFMFVSLQAIMMLVQQRFLSIGLESVGAPAHFHLQNPQVHANLQKRSAISRGNLAGVHSAGFMWPGAKEVCEVDVFHKSDFRRFRRGGKSKAFFGLSRTGDNSWMGSANRLDRTVMANPGPAATCNLTRSQAESNSIRTIACKDVARRERPEITAKNMLLDKDGGGSMQLPVREGLGLRKIEGSLW